MYYFSIISTALFLLWFHLVPKIHKTDNGSYKRLGLSNGRTILICVISCLYMINFLSIVLCLFVLKHKITEYQYNNVFSEDDFIKYNKNTILLLLKNIK